MLWLTPAVLALWETEAKRKLWVQGQPGLCSHVLLSKISLLAQSKPGRNGPHDTILTMSNMKTQPKTLWDGSVDEGNQSSSEGTHMVERKPILWVGLHTPWRTWLWALSVFCLSLGKETIQRKTEPQRLRLTSLWTVFDFLYFSTVSNKYGWIIWWKGKACLSAAYTTCLC